MFEPECIADCRALRLEHEFEYGDWYTLEADPSEVAPSVLGTQWGVGPDAMARFRSQRPIWLPLLHQWPDLLQAVDPVKRYEGDPSYRLSWLQDIIELALYAPEFCDQSVSPERAAVALYGALLDQAAAPPPPSISDLLPKPSE